MTEKLYEFNSYLFSFDANVLSCNPKKDLYDVILDKTAFFPEGGGQTADTGFIGGTKVVDVQIDNGIIHHYTVSPVSGLVKCEINKDERFIKMQNHSGEHIFSGVINKLYGLDNIGFNLGEEYITADYNGILSKEQILEAERAANKAIYENLPIIISKPSQDELAKMHYRSKLDLKNDVRIVEIPGYDICACCAPHVAHTGEIGIIKVIDIGTQNKHSRIQLMCGKLAVDYTNMLLDNLTDISRMLSAKRENSAETFNKLNKYYNQCRFELAKANKIIAISEAEKITPQDDNYCFFGDYNDIEILRGIVNAMKCKLSGIATALYGTEKNGYIFVSSSENINMKDIAVKMRKELNAKCGGSESMIQGSIFAGKEQIENFFK